MTLHNLILKVCTTISYKIKTQERNRLDPSDDMRVALSKKEPRFEKIARNKQQQKSH